MPVELALVSVEDSKASVKRPDVDSDRPAWQLTPGRMALEECRDLTFGIHSPQASHDE